MLGSYLPTLVTRKGLSFNYIGLCWNSKPHGQYMTIRREEPVLKGKTKFRKKRHLQNKNQEKLGAKLEEEKQNLSRFHKNFCWGIEQKPPLWCNGCLPS